MEVIPLPDERPIIARGGWAGILGNAVYSRCCLMGCIVVVECSLATALHHAWLQTRTFTTVAIFFFIALLFFGRDRLKAAQWSAPPIHNGWVVLHVFALLLFGATNSYLTFFASPGTDLERVVLWVWYSLLVILPITLGGALFSLPKLLLLLQSLGNAWGLAAICDVLMMSVRSLLILEWDRPHSWLGHAMQVATFRGVGMLLHLFYSNVVTDPAHFTVGTSAIQIIIADGCSGIEGLALMSSLTVGWLFYARRELRLGRALLLVPFSLLLTWLLNMVRIATLIAIGNAGYPAVALGGFHSQAGWILCSCTAMGFLLTVNNVAWFRQPEAAANSLQSPASQRDGALLADTNLAAVYLLPFLAILAAGMLAQAVSDGFEWLYALRLFAALGVFYAYRRQYRRMDWRFGWLGIAAGVAVFALWVLLDRVIGREEIFRNAIGGAPTSGAVLTSVGEGLARLSRSQRAVWIAVRTVAAVTTVPLAEELAFRGFIARRILSPNVEGVSYRSLSLVAILVSSLAFGILHGRMWLAGMIAGMVFAGVAKLRGRLGEAVAAHATANLLIALWVIARGDYSLW